MSEWELGAYLGSGKASSKEVCDGLGLSVVHWARC